MIKRPPRFDVAYQCALVDGEGEEHAVRVTDISREGCKVALARPLKIGEHVVIRLASQGDQAAKVRWAMAGEAGLAFSSPLPLED